MQRTSTAQHFLDDSIEEESDNSPPTPPCQTEAHFRRTLQLDRRGRQPIVLRVSLDHERLGSHRQWLLRRVDKRRIVPATTTIDDVKCELELLSGIPFELQRIMYLDRMDLHGASTLRRHRIVRDDSELTLGVYDLWQRIVGAAMDGGVARVVAQLDRPELPTTTLLKLPGKGASLTAMGVKRFERAVRDVARRGRLRRSFVQAARKGDEEEATMEFRLPSESHSLVGMVFYCIRM